MHYFNKAAESGKTAETVAADERAEDRRTAAEKVENGKVTVERAESGRTAKVEAWSGKATVEWIEGGQASAEKVEAGAAGAVAAVPGAKNGKTPAGKAEDGAEAAAEAANEKVNSGLDADEAAKGKVNAGLDDGTAADEKDGDRLDDGTSAQMDFRERYRLCQEMLGRREMLRKLDEREKDITAQRFARKEYLDLTVDWAFKYLFRNHKDLLLMLLQDILNENITDLEYQDSELLKLFADDKTVIFDLLCQTADGQEFIVEMQKVWRKDQRDRLVYYGAALIRERLKAGDREYLLKPLKIICIMDYEEAHDNVPENKIVFQYRLVEVETYELYGQQLSIYLVELPRVMRLTNNFDNPVAGWCQIFRNIATFAETRAAKDGRFQKVVKAMKVSGLSEKEIIEYFSDMYTLEDYKPYIDGATELGYRKGLEEGREEGREEERSSIVLKMRELNIPLKQIMSITGLSAEEVKQYLN